jgi:hypothetical protein
MESAGLPNTMGTILARDMKIVIASDNTIDRALNGKPVVTPAPAPVPTPAPVPVSPPPVQHVPVTDTKPYPWLAPVAAAALGLAGLGAGMGLGSLLDKEEDQPVVQQPITNDRPTPQINITSPPDWKARAYVSKPETRGSK